MKKIYLLVFLGFVVLFSSCVDIEEHYTFKADGSCSVAYNFDMSKAVSVLMNLMTDSIRETPEFNMVKDTTLNFYSALPDSTQQKMNVNDADMAKTSNLNINMNLKKNLMRVSLKHDAKNVKELQYYLEHIAKITNSGNVSAITRNAKKNTFFDPQQLISGEDYYIYEITPHKFYRIIDLSKFNAFIKRTQATFAMAKAMLIETPYKLVLNFAKPVKKINNPKAILSADRKRVTLQTNMDEIIKNPASMNLKIDF